MCNHCDVSMMDALRDMQSRDPDGWETREPTADDRQAFEAWAIATYGQDAWGTYKHTAWDATYD
jgi:hypothetical protein